MLSINKQKIVKILGEIFLISALMILLGGPLTYGQYFLSGSIEFNSFYFKIIMLMSGVLTLILKRHLIPKKIFIAWALLIISILLTTAYNVIFLYRDLSQLFVGINSYMSLAILTPLAFLFKSGNYIRRLINLIAVISIPIAMFGILQYINNQTYLPEIKINDRNFINSIWFFDRIRAVSLFNSGLDFGIFLLFSFSIIISNNSIFRGVIKLLALLILITAIYMTLTRNVYIGLFLSLTTFIITFTPYNVKSRIMTFIPGLFVAFSLLILFLPQGAESGVANANSLDARLEIWRESFQRLNMLGLPGILFGSGEVQSYTLESTSTTIIDNYPLALIFFGGASSLVAFYSYLLSLWFYVVKNMKSSKLSNVVLIAVSASFGMQMFNIIAVMPFICFIFMFLAHGEENEDHSYPQRVS